MFLCAILKNLKTQILAHVDPSYKGMRIHVKSSTTFLLMYKDYVIYKVTRNGDKLDCVYEHTCRAFTGLTVEEFMEMLVEDGCCA